MNPVISQLEALIARLDRRRAHIELSLMDQTRPAQEQEQLEQTYDLLFELRQIAATSLAVVQRTEKPHSSISCCQRYFLAAVKILTQAWISSIIALKTPISAEWLGISSALEIVPLAASAATAGTSGSEGH